jgi:hypothetical protein
VDAHHTTDGLTTLCTGTEDVESLREHTGVLFCFMCGAVVVDDRQH